MDDDAAFMQLILSNAQGELSSLERGMHALAATRRGKRQDEYAKECGVAKNTVTHWIQAAEVAAEVEVSQHTIAEPAPITQALSPHVGTGDPRDLMAVLADRLSQLREIHGAPRDCRVPLAVRMVHESSQKMPGHLLEISSNGPINCSRSTAHRTEVQAARVAKNGQPFFGDLLERTNQLIAIHSAAQGELSPLERGMHALAATRRGKRQDEYAKECGVAKNTVTHWIQAAEVAAEVEVSQHTLAGPAAITQALSSHVGTGDPRDLMAVLAARVFRRPVKRRNPPFYPRVPSRQMPGGAPRRAGANSRVGPRDG